MGSATKQSNLEIRNEDGIISVHPPLNVPEIKGMGSTFFDKIREHKDGVAQIHALTGEKETWDQLLQRSIRTAIAMRSRGITSEHLVSVCSLANLDSCVPFIAGLFLGCKIANLDPRIPLDDTVHLLQQISPNIIFVAQEAIHLIEDALREAKISATIVVFGESTNHLQFSEFLQPSAEEKNFVPVEIKNVKDTAIIVFSSGTTGLPKGICMSHYGLLVPKLSNDSLKPYAGKIFLSFSSLFWISATTILISSILTGFTRLVCPSFDANKVWGILTDYKPNLFVTTPTNIIATCKTGRPETADTSALKLIVVTGAPVSMDQIVEMRQFFPGTLIINMFASSELSGNGFMWNPEADHQLVLEKPHSAGRPTYGLQYKVVDPETEQILGPNQEGELRIKADFCMNGYYNIDSSDAWDSDGFIKTGDVAYYDGKFRFFIVDRIKEMMKFQGWLVVPAKIEAVLLSHPAVKAAVVFGVHNPADGDHPTGLVVIKETLINSVTEQELEKYVEERVHSTQRLRGGVQIVKSIPVTPSGKYNRRSIRKMVLQRAI